MYTCWTRVLLNIEGIRCSGDGNAYDSIDYTEFMELHVWLIYLHMDDLFTRSLSFLSCVIQQSVTQLHVQANYVIITDHPEQLPNNCWYNIIIPYITCV